MDREERLEAARERMVAAQLAARGIDDERVLEALRQVPRHRFVPPELADYAYDDNALPIGEGQTISQPYIVALMAQAARIGPQDTVLDVGTGSGYGAAVLGKLALEVYSIERHEPLAQRAAHILTELGYDNVEVRHGDGARGWPAEAPFDVIIVAAGGRRIPPALLDQLAVGGRLIIPVGDLPHSQQLLRVVRTSEDSYERQNLGPVAFVPLVESSGHGNGKSEHHTGDAPARVVHRSGSGNRDAYADLERHAEPFASVQQLSFDGMLGRIGDARVVCIGEATHGTHEFYAIRERLTRALIEHAGFNIVAAEADWPDAAHIDGYVHGGEGAWWEGTAFVRFPTWMWRNEEVHGFADWLREWNSNQPRERQAGFYGLDLYSLYSSIDAVLRYLGRVAPIAAAVAKERYGCLLPWRGDPAAYGRFAITRGYRDCEREVVAMLTDLRKRAAELAGRNGKGYSDVLQNARVIANAEKYYRIMYYGSVESWNLRDQHMFDTLLHLLEAGGPDSRAVVWAHNSHLGDARATEMGGMGEHNVGQLCRQRFGDAAYLIGFGTDRGTVVAASQWDGEPEVKRVQPALEGSCEQFFRGGAHLRFCLPLRESVGPALNQLVESSMLQRAIGVIYRPDSERFSHYFEARLAQQFDEYIWLAETSHVTPLPARIREEVPETYPTGL